MLSQKYTVQFFVSFYKQESDAQDHDVPQVLQGVLKCIHSFTNELWLMSIMCQTLCHLPPYVVLSDPHIILI